MRNKAVVLRDKKIVINEMTIRELKELSKRINVDLNIVIDTDLKDKKSDEVVNNVFSIVESQLVNIFPQLTSDDIDNSYMSDIEKLIEAFIEVNFTGLKKVMSKVINTKQIP